MLHWRTSPGNLSLVSARPYVKAPPVGHALSAKTLGKQHKSKRGEAPEEARRVVAANLAKLPETVREFVLAMLSPSR
jgi:hypothetical protein